MDRIKIEIAAPYDSEKIEEEKRKKNKEKKKKPSLISSFFIGLIIACIISMIAILRLGDEMAEFGVTSTHIFLATLVFTILIELVAMSSIFDKYAKKYNMFHRRLIAFFGLFFVYVMLPFMLFTPVLLGAVHEKYPFESNYTTATNKTFEMAGDAFGDAFQRLNLKLYNLGSDRPVFYIILIIAIVLIATYFSIRYSKHGVYEEMEAQELIDTLSEKDYNYEPPKNKFEGLFKKKQHDQEMKGGMKK